MTETVLALPFYMFVLFMILFFGQSFVRKQQVQLAGHYSAWRTFDDQTPSEARLRGLVLNNAPSGVYQEIEAPDDQPLENWVDATGRQFGDAEPLARELLLRRWHSAASADGRLGRLADIRVLLEVQYPTSIAAMDFLNHELTSREMRSGQEWTYPDAHQNGALRELYYDDLDDSLESIGGQGAGFAGRIRQLYNAQW